MSQEYILVSQEHILVSQEYIIVSHFTRRSVLLRKKRLQQCAHKHKASIHQKSLKTSQNHWKSLFLIEKQRLRRCAQKHKAFKIKIRHFGSHISDSTNKVNNHFEIVHTNSPRRIYLEGSNPLKSKQNQLFWEYQVFARNNKNDKICC